MLGYIVETNSLNDNFYIKHSLTYHMLATGAMPPQHTVRRITSIQRPQGSARSLIQEDYKGEL